MILALVYAQAASAPAPAALDSLPVVVLETEFGAITLEIDTRRAPITAANFLKYVAEGQMFDDCCQVPKLQPHFFFRSPINRLNRNACSRLSRSEAALDHCRIATGG